ncbi:hypothetical protein GCM10027061_04230 [Nesterenkonia suensis]
MAGPAGTVPNRCAAVVEEQHPGSGGVPHLGEPVGMLTFLVPTVDAWPGGREVEDTGCGLHGSTVALTGDLEDGLDEVPEHGVP